MQKLYNNILFEKKHHYASILRETDILKGILEKEREENGDDAIENQLRTVYKMRNIAFAGLVKEGMRCFTIKDLESDDVGTSTVGIVIDGKRYDCRASVLEKTLIEEYGDPGLNMGKKDNGTFKPGKGREPSDDVEEDTWNRNKVATNSASRQEAKVEKTTPIPTIEKPINPLTVEKEGVEPNLTKPFQLEKAETAKDQLGFIPEKATDRTKPVKELIKPESLNDNIPIPKKEERIITAVIGDVELEEIEVPQKHSPIQLSQSKSELKQVQIPETPLKKRFVRPDEPESEKNIESMVFDMIDVGIVQKSNNKGEYVNFTIVPLEISKKDKAISDIFVCMETNDTQKVYSSETNGRKTVTAKIGEYEFIVKGSWKDQKFVSAIYPANQMTTDEYVKNEDRKEFMPSDPKVIGYGHNVSLINEKSGGVTKVHIAPLDVENNDKGIVNIMVCVENSVGERVLKVSNNGMVLYETSEYTAQIMGFWKGKVFVSNVKVTNK